MEGERGMQAAGSGLSHRGRTAPGAAGAGGPCGAGPGPGTWSMSG